MKTILEMTIASTVGIVLVSPLGGPLAVGLSILLLGVLAAIHFITYGIQS